MLIVDDNEDAAQMLAEFLSGLGFEVEVAFDPPAALALAAQFRPQIALLDIGLPVMDGWEATQQLKADPQTCHIPVIALTAHAMSGDREKAIAAGCDDYDTKPIDLPRLLNKIEGCMKRPNTN